MTKALRRTEDNSLHLTGIGLFVGAVLLGLLVWFLVKRTSAPVLASGTTELSLSDIDALKTQLKGRISGK